MFGVALTLTTGIFPDVLVMLWTPFRMSITSAWAKLCSAYAVGLTRHTLKPLLLHAECIVGFRCFTEAGMVLRTLSTRSTSRGVEVRLTFEAVDQFQRLKLVTRIIV